MVCAEADSVCVARVLQSRRPAPTRLLPYFISLNKGDGIELVREVRAHHPQLPILVFSTHDEGHLCGTNVVRRLPAATRCHETSDRRADIALSAACDRRWYLRVRGCRRQYDSTRGRRRQTYIGRPRGRPPDQSRASGLAFDPGKGMSTRECALAQLEGMKTIESHRQRIKGKINLRNGTQLVQFAVNWLLAENAGAISRVDPDEGRVA